MDPRSPAGAAAAGATAVVVALVVVAYVVLGGASDAEESVAPETYRDVTLGVDKEALTERLLPARPVDAQVLGRHQSREPETVDRSCVHYRAADSGGHLYRFCFEDDRLVGKSIVVPDGG